ncbi:MAG: metal ABC transporter ATP-binding protein [Oscillospiraceae bacterium]|nr:metal ABC transporter ATP-binding protein [Oscillospiraceae bacterium]
METKNKPAAQAERKVLLACRDVSLGYEHKPLLEHLDFSVCSGDYVAVLGENGSGKSTLLKSLLGLTPPLAGTIERPAQKAGQLGYLPQQTPAQRDFPASAEEVVLSGFLNRRSFRLRYSPQERSAALMHMGKLGVLELKDKCYRELSGGQQQRVLLCRALCAANELLILDEPVTGLDPAASQDLYKTLRYLNGKENMAILMVTHDVTAALREAKTILHIGQKRWFCGTAEAYLRDESGRRFSK